MGPAGECERNEVGFIVFNPRLLHAASLSGVESRCHCGLSVRGRFNGASAKRCAAAGCVSACGTITGQMNGLQKSAIIHIAEEPGADVVPRA